jgi:hypothetical protein
LEGSVPGEGSFLSRFTLKFLEVLTAGIATAVSGFLIAHFAGYLAVPASAPAVMQPAAIQGVQSGTQGAVPADPAAPAPAAPPAVINAAPAAVNAAPAAALHQSTPADEPPSSGGPEAKPHDAAETKPRDAAKRASAPSFEARVRAALAKVGASPAPGDVPRRGAVSPTDSAPRPPAAEQRPPDTPTGSIASAPRPTDSAPRLAPGEPPSAAATPAPQAPTIQNTGGQNSAVQLAPPAAVEIKSQPVAGVDTNQPAQAAAEPPGADQDGTFAAIAKRLRSDKPLSEDQAPRPPMPVGQ